MNTELGTGAAVPRPKDDASAGGTGDIRSTGGPRSTAGIFVAIVAGTLAISIDFASVDLALPALEAQFGFGLDGAQWVINGYVLAFAVFMVTGGRLADSYGRKRIFLLGLAIFALASLLGGLSWSGGSLIGFRVLQGVGAALLWPAMVGISSAAVSAANRGFAVGLVMGTCSIGNAAGPIIGGALTQWLSWRWVLWINVPMALLAIAITLATLRDDRDKLRREPNDYAGMAMLTIGLVAMILAVDQSGAWGWSDPWTLGLLAVAALLLGLFPLVERRRPNALVPIDLLRNGEFVTLCAAATGVCLFFFVILLYLPQQAMKFEDVDAMRAGARVVPLMAGFGVLSFYGGSLYRRFGARVLMLSGLTAVAAGGVALALVGFDGPAPVLWGVLGVLGVGVGLSIPTLGTRAVEVAGMERASLASGVTFMFQLAGAALFFAIATTLFVATSERALERSLARDREVLQSHERIALDGLLAGAATARTLALPRVADAPALRSQLVLAAREAYGTGVRTMMLFAAGVVVATLLLALRFVRGKSGAPAPPEDEDEV